MVKNVADWAADGAAAQESTPKAVEDAISSDYEDRQALISAAMAETPGANGKAWADVRYDWWADGGVIEGEGEGEGEEPE